MIFTKKILYRDADGKRCSHDIIVKGKKNTMGMTLEKEGEAKSVDFIKKMLAEGGEYTGSSYKENA